MNNHGAVLLGETLSDQLAPPPAPLEVSVALQFEAFAGRLSEFERRVMDHLLWERRRPVPVRHRSIGSGITDPTGFVILDLLGPTQGHVWQVLGLSVGGLTTTTRAAGRADVFISKAGYAGYSSLVGPGLTDWRDFTPTLPNVALYDPDQLFLHGEEHLYVAVSQATAGQQFVAGASIVDTEG